METAEKTREIRLRRAAKRQGLTLHRSRVRDPRALSYARYRLERDGHVIAGGDGTGYSMTMDDIEQYLNGERAEDASGAGSP
ncbi:hypothetical protein ACFT0G_06170 [Streptomyces sp. NPDC057020]|uniref:hypothetical protein n=1 Tax=unclassified Streptomyces TaxID=2593676 RepID=UPI00362FB892